MSPDMKDRDHQQYRDDLAKELRGQTDREKRREMLEEAKGTEEYQEADIFKIQERFRAEIDDIRKKWEEHPVSLDMDTLARGSRFSGATGEYEFEKVSRSGLLESIVRDGQNKEFFVTTKMAREQALASLVGGFVAGRAGQMDALRFPEIRLEHINGKTVALMEFFRGYEEVPYDESEKTPLLSEDEKAFLSVLNIWMGNWDFKADHVLVSPDKSSRVIGLIDLEKSFDFDNPKRLQKTADREPFVGRGAVSDEKIVRYTDLIAGLDIRDRNEIVKKAIASGFASDEIIGIVINLMKRRTEVKDDIERVSAMKEAQDKLDAAQ